MDMAGNRISEVPDFKIFREHSPQPPRTLAPSALGGANSAKTTVRASVTKSAESAHA